MTTTTRPASRERKFTPPSPGGIRLRRRALLDAGPVLLVAAVAVATSVSFGVAPRDLLVFLAYEVVFVAVPGTLLYRALAPGDGRLTTLAFGWAVGYALEMIVYLLLTVAGVRGAFFGYPFVAIPLCGLLALRRRRADAAVPVEEPTQGTGWAIAALCATMLVFLSGSLFTGAPLPGTVKSVSYNPDLVFQVSSAAEIRHHWPVEDPKVAGTPVAYHVFAYLHMSALDQVTKLGLPLIVFRLTAVMAALLVVVQLCVAGSIFGRARWVGPLAAAIAIFVSEVDLDSRTNFLGGLLPFFGEATYIGLVLSPTFVFSLLFFVPSLVLLARLLGALPDRGPRRGTWLLLALFLVGCVGTKAMSLPVLIGGLVVFLALVALRERRVDRPTALALGVSCAVMALFMLTLYRGASVGETGVKLQFASSMRLMYPLDLLEARLGAWFWAPAIPIGLAALFAAPLAGLAWFLGGGGRFARRHVLLLSIFASSLIPFVVIRQPFGNHVFVTAYGFVGAAIVSADGVYALWTRTPRRRREHLALAIFGILFAASLLYVPVVTLRWLSLDGLRLYAAWCAYLALVFAAIAFVWWRSPARRGAAVRLALAAALITGAVNIPLDLVPPLATAALNDVPPYNTGDLTPDLYRGLSWIRDNTREDDVLAVSAQHGALGFPDNFYYSAFAERRVYLEGWLYTARSFEVGVEDVRAGKKLPYPERLALNDAVFRRGDARALHTLVRDYGVRYLVMDKVHGPRLAGPAKVGHLVFANRDVEVYAVGPA